MALSFLYRAFVRVLQLVRLFCPKDSNLAVEVGSCCATSSRYSDARYTNPALQPATLLRRHRDLVAKLWTKLPAGLRYWLTATRSVELVYDAR